MSLIGKVAIITGASSGIGAATAVLFSKNGASLTLNGRNEYGLDKTIAQCEPANKDKIIKVIGDVTNIETLKSLVNETIEKFGRIDILINCAGYFAPADIETLKIEDYDRIMNVNLRAPILLTQLCVPHLTATKGSIVNVSSLYGTKSFPNVFGYGVSKAGMDQFTKQAALELAPKGIRVNSVNPGVTMTNGLKAGIPSEFLQQFVENIQRIYPLGRTGDSSETAKAIMFLASNDASFTTGELFHVDGGIHVVTPR